MSITQTIYRAQNLSRKDRRKADYELSDRAIVMCECLAEIRGTSFVTQANEVRGRRENRERADINIQAGRKV